MSSPKNTDSPAVKSAAAKTAAPAGSTHAGRRVAFGFNVTLAIVAALILLVFVNWISYRRFLRYDLTSTRQYSLSPQTRELLKEVKEPYRVVTLLSGAAGDSSEAREVAILLSRARDLADEYGRYCPNLKVEHIDADLNASGVKAFYASLLERYKAKLAPQAAGVEGGRKALDALRADATALKTPLADLGSDESLTDDRLKQDLLSVGQYFARFDKQLDGVMQQVTAATEAGLPDYTAALAVIRTELGDLSEKVFGVVIDRFGRAAETSATPDSIKPKLKSLASLMRESRRNIDVALTAIKDVLSVEDYDRLREQLAGRNSVVVMSPDRERVIQLDEMFRRPDPAQTKALQQAGEEAELAFQGEERLTGALVSLGLKNPPLVVFIFTGRQRALGPNGEYEMVAQRLRRINFDVQEWSPIPRPSMYGQIEPPAPLPVAKPGQKAVWIILPMEPPNPVNPMASGGDQVVAALKQRLAAGDSAMIMLDLAPVGFTGQADPLAGVFEPWSIKPQTDRVLLREITVANRQTRVASLMDVDNWPGDQPVTRSLAGMQGAFLRSMPLDIDTAAAASKGVKVWPLVTVKKDDVWAERNLQDLVNSKKDPASAGKSYTIAAAAESKTNRLIVVGDPIWATDQITSLGLLGPGTAELVGSRFPGNAELFVNGVFWLSHMDQLIAASARSQDIRRIRPMTATTLRNTQWGTLAAMPLATIIAGVGVWLIRRRA
ncbi:MAG: Gldg family protein [Planctomycetota bacterium]|nr:Gldg family protein [Planctomycetota bacterium]